MTEREFQEKQAQIDELGARFGIGDTVAELKLWDLLYSEPMRRWMKNSIIWKSKRPREEYAKNDLDFEDALQEVAEKFVGDFQPEKAREMGFFTYFYSSVYYRFLEHGRQGMKRVRDENGEVSYVSRTVSLDASVNDENGKDTFLDMLEDTQSGAEERLFRKESAAAAEEDILHICRLILDMKTQSAPAGKTAAKKLVYYRLIYTNQTVDSVRRGVEEDSVFLRHERDFMASLDRNLLDFTYCQPVETIPQVCTGGLKTYRQMDIDVPDAKQTAVTPFIAKILQAVLTDRHGLKVSGARLSQLKDEWAGFAAGQLAAQKG